MPNLNPIEEIKKLEEERKSIEANHREALQLVRNCEGRALQIEAEIVTHKKYINDYSSSEEEGISAGEPEGFNEGEACPAV